MIKKINSGLLFITSILVANLPFRQAGAQQIDMVSHYFYKPMVYNPAFTGEGDGTNILLIHHTQWADFKGAPQLDIFSADKNFMNKKMGLGMEVISDKKGINNNITGNLFYSYKVQINDNAHLSLGMSFGVVNQSLNYSKVLVENTTDPTLFPDAQHKTSYDGNAGLALISKGLEFGAAVPHLFGNKIKFSDNNVNAYYAQARHFMISLKYKFFLSKEKGISISPSGLVRFVPNAPFQYDGNINLDWKDKFWVGATYKSNYAIAANIGFCIHKQFSVGYSYDIITGSIGNYAGLSHEIMLNIKFGKNKKVEPKPIAEDSSKEEIKTPEPKPVAPLPVKVETKSPEPKPVIKETTKTPTLEYEAYIKHQSDSLEQLKLKEEKKKIKENLALNNKNSEAVQNNTNKITSKGVWIATNKASDFKDANNHIPEAGYYVIVGSFHTREFALAEVKRMINEGLKAANWIYYESANFNYVFTSKANTKEEAFKQITNAKVVGYEDIWIQHIIK